MAITNLLYPIASIILIRNLIVILLTPSHSEMELWSQAYKEIQTRSLDQLPKDSPLLERCAKPDLYNKPCSQKLNLKLGDDFCEKSDVHKLMHPDKILKDKFVLRDQMDFQRLEYIYGWVYDVFPKWSQPDLISKQPAVPIPLETTVMWTVNRFSTQFYDIGRQYLCMFQKDMSLPGEDKIVKKSWTPSTIHAYKDKLRAQNAPEQCIKQAQIELPTLRMWVKEECQRAFELLLSKDHLDKLKTVGIQYLLKTDTHWGEGITLLFENNFNQLKKWYKNGEGCGQNKSTIVLQRYIQNPMLHEGYKMELRILTFVASLDPMVIYVNPRPVFRLCAEKFQLNVNVREAHVCNPKTIRQYLDHMDLPRFEEFMINEGFVKEAGWIDKVFVPNLKRLIVHLFQGGKDYLLKTTRVAEFYALDIIMGTDSQLYMLELNNSPAYGNHLRDRRVLFNTQIPPMLEIPFKYIASRYTRIRKFMAEKLIPKMKSNEYQTNKSLKEQLLQEFDKINKDYLEEDLKISEDNTFLLVMDKNLKGEASVGNLLPKECVID